MDKVKEKRGKKMVWIVIAVIAVILVASVLVILPPGRGELPKFYNEDGTILEGSLSEKTDLKVKDTTLGMILTAKDVTKPVLLFLGGGPGIPEYLLEAEYPTRLAEEFVVCYLEYRGTSLSYDPKLNRDTLTTKQYIEDVVEVTNYLRERFGQDKIYIMGHSFGTYIGLNTVSQYPNLYLAYIAMSQMCNQHASEYLAYDYMLDYYQKAKNTKKVRQFESCPIKDSEKAYTKYCTSLLRDNSMHELGIGTARNMKSLVTGIILPASRCKAYSMMERINIWRGKIFSQNSQVAQEAWSFDAFNQIKEIQIPIYFLAGEYDYTCCYSLQKEYYEQIKAPVKGFYTFTESAHSPFFEEPHRGLKILVHDVKNGLAEMAD